MAVNSYLRWHPQAKTHERTRLNQLHRVESFDIRWRLYIQRSVGVRTIEKSIPFWEHGNEARQSNAVGHNLKPDRRTGSARHKDKDPSTELLFV